MFHTKHTTEGFLHGFSKHVSIIFLIIGLLSSKKESWKKDSIIINLTRINFFLFIS